MKVKELIAILQKHSGELDILIDERDEFSDFHDIYDVNVQDKKNGIFLAIIPGPNQSTTDWL